MNFFASSCTSGLGQTSCSIALQGLHQEAQNSTRIGFDCSLASLAASEYFLCHSMLLAASARASKGRAIRMAAAHKYFDIIFSPDRCDSLLCGFWFSQSSTRLVYYLSASPGILKKGAQISVR